MKIQWVWATVFTGVLAATNTLALDSPVIGPGGGQQDPVVAEPPPCNDCFAPGTFEPPEAPVTITIMGRTDTSISFTWHENASIVDGYIVERKQGADGPWIPVFSGEPERADGWASYTDEGLSPDTPYGYRIYAYNSHGNSLPSSPVRWAYTRDGRDIAVRRIQLRIHTADIDNAGTDSAVNVRLNPDAPYTTPAFNSTWLDHGRDDFERGDVHVYDLNLTSVGDLSDITQIVIEKPGSDGWCIEQFSLEVNNTEQTIREVYHADFRSTPDTCLWLDNEDGGEATYTVSHDMLRADPLWWGYTSPPLYEIVQLDEEGLYAQVSRREMENRIESIVGHSIHDTQLKWGHINGPAVEISKIDDQTFHLDLDLEADVTGPNPEVDVDVDVELLVSCGEDIETPEITVTATPDATVDSDWYWELASLGLLELLDSIINDCIDDVVSNLTFVANIALSPDLPLCPTITVEEEANIRLGLEPPSTSNEMNDPGDLPGSPDSGELAPTTTSSSEGQSSDRVTPDEERSTGDTKTPSETPELARSTAETGDSSELAHSAQSTR